LSVSISLKYNLNSTSDSPRRLLLKVSGEGFSRDGETGLDTERVKILAEQLRHLTSNGVQVACVIGGGNILRGKQSDTLGIGRATADYMGMLATVINGLALCDALEANNVPTRVMSAIDVHKVCEPFIRRRAISHLDSLTFDEVIANKLEVMDQTAFTLCREHNLPVTVFDMMAENGLVLAATGKKIGTRIHN
jgi:uridylate kinase